MNKLPLWIAIAGISIATIFGIVILATEQKAESDKYEAQFQWLLGEDIIISGDTLTVIDLGYRNGQYMCELETDGINDRIRVEVCEKKAINRPVRETPSEVP